MKLFSYLPVRLDIPAMPMETGVVGIPENSDSVVVIPVMAAVLLLAAVAAAGIIFFCKKKKDSKNVGKD